MKRVLNIVVISLITLLVVGCTEKYVSQANDFPTSTSFALNLQQRLFAQAARDIGWYQPRHSEELSNILERNIRQNDPSHRSYLYLIAFGKIMAYFPIIGKCTSTQSRITPETHLVTYQVNNSDTGGEMQEVPGLDGSYGQNEAGIFCFLDKPGRPMITWSGDFLISDAFVPLKQAPELVLTASGHAGPVKRGSSH